METYNRDRHLHGVEEYEEQIHSTTGRDFSIGLAIGLVVGTMGGLFLAPKSGDALRDDISGTTNKLTETFNAKQDEGSNDESLKAKAEQKTEELRSKLEEKKDDMVVKKSEQEEKQRIKDIDEKEIQAQKRAIQDDVADEGTEDPRKVDMSKYSEQPDEEK